MSDFRMYICLDNKQDEYTKSHRIMKLSKKAIRKIDKTTMLKLAIVLGFTELWVSRLVKRNKANGPLTTPSALDVLRQATGFTDDQILEAEPATSK